SVQAFIDSFRDPDEEVRNAGHLALLTVPRQALPLLAKALKHPDVVMRREAVETIKKIGMEGHAGTDVRALIGDLLLAMKDTDREVSEGASWAVGEIDPQLKAALPALREAVQNAQRTGGRNLAGRIDFQFIPTAELARAIPAEKGDRLRQI